MKKILVLMFVLFAFTYGSSEKIVKYGIDDLPYTYDPQSNTDSFSSDVISYLFEGLTKMDSKGNPIPGVAESWTNNGNIWTFNLRKNAKWSNGELVTAKDFVNAWERALNPNTEAEYSYIMYCIKGAQEYNEGTNKKFSSVGIKAIDNYTLQVTLKEPTIYFPTLVSFYTFYPQNTNFLKSLKNSIYGDSFNSIIGNGAFEVKKSSNNNLYLTKSDKYWDKDNINIDTINFVITDSKDLIKDYQLKKLDICPLNDENYKKYKLSKDVKIYEDGSVWYLNLNTINYFLSNPKVRKAMSMAIDRDSFIKNVKNNLGSIAESVIPLGIKGNSDFYRNEYNQSLYNISYNPQKAKELLNEGLKELGINKSEIETINLLSGNSETAISEAEFLANQLKINLDLDINVESVSTLDRFSRTTSGDYDIALSGWSPDYNDPTTFLENWTSFSAMNYTYWSNEEYDTLINEAKIENNSNKRMDLLAKSEEILMDKLPIIPIYFRKKAVLINPNIDKVEFSLFSPTINFGYSDTK